MGRLQIVLRPEVEKKFRQHLGKGEGLKKGMISQEIEKLILLELDNPNREPKSGIILNPKPDLKVLIAANAKQGGLSEVEYIIKILEFMHFDRPDLLGLNLKKEN